MLKRMLHSAQTVLTKPVTLTGTEIQATETVNAKFDDFQMYGKTTQDGEPTPDNPIEIMNAGKYNEETGRYEHKFTVGNKNLIVNEATSTNYSGVDLTVNKDGSISVKGTNTLTYGLDLLLTKKMFLKAGEYVISGGVGNNISIFIHELNTYNYIFSNQRGGNSHPVIYTKDTYVEIAIRIIAGATVDDIIYPMLRVKGGDSTFAPLVAKNLTITSPVPITKWDKLVKRDGVWGWSIYGKEYKMTADEVTISANNASNNIVRVLVYNVGAKINTECKCNLLPCSQQYIGHNVGGYHFTEYAFTVYMSNTILSQYGYEYDETLDKNTLTKRATDAYRELIRAAGGIQIVVDMQEEQAFHPLPDEEQALMNSLQSYYPTTIIRNTEDLEMEVTMKSLNILGGGGYKLLRLLLTQRRWCYA